MCPDLGNSMLTRLCAKGVDEWHREFLCCSSCKLTYFRTSEDLFADSSLLCYPCRPVLEKHYPIFKRFLAHSLPNNEGNPKPNQLEKKFLQISLVHFQETSTDIHDELLRRRNAAGQRTNSTRQAPSHLLPNDNFDLERKQFRQFLGTLRSSEFRYLVTSIFYVVERRIARFPRVDTIREGSPAPVHDPSVGLEHPMVQDQAQGTSDLQNQILRRKRNLDSRSKCMRCGQIAEDLERDGYVRTDDGVLCMPCYGRLMVRRRKGGLVL